MMPILGSRIKDRCTVRSLLNEETHSKIAEHFEENPTSLIMQESFLYNLKTNILLHFFIFSKKRHVFLSSYFNNKNNNQ